MATGRIGTTPVLQVRWSKAPSAGTTSLSGLDDNSVSLVYSVGYEAVYQNGVLLSRGNDYTATNGTTITLTTATVAGDIIEVFANQTIPLTDTYSQTVSDGRFIKNTLTTTTGDIIYASAANTPARLGIGSTDQVLKVSGGVPAWGAGPALTKITTGSFTSVASVTIDNVFNSTYTRYVMQLKATGNTLGADLELQMRYGSSTQTTAYYGSGNVLERTNTSVNFGYQNTGAGTLVNTLTSNGSSNLEIFFDRVGQSSELFAMWGTGYSEYENGALQFAGSNGQDRTYTGVIIKCSSGTITGTYKIYGLEN